MKPMNLIYVGGPLREACVRVDRVGSSHTLGHDPARTRSRTATFPVRTEPELVFAAVTCYARLRI
jgi:hypothetical protein